VTRPPGPVETYPWPERLRCHVVTPGDDPRLHGYSVEGDLANHYRFSDVVLLALTGELPSDEQGQAFDAALIVLAPLSMAAAPTHATALAQICGSRSSSILGVGAVALAERARHVIAQAAPLLEWLASTLTAPPPPALTAASDEDKRALERFRGVLAARGVRVPALDHPLSREAALIATLWFAGLTRREQLEAALVLASLPAVSAEAHLHGVASFREYPMQLPPFAYEDP
jgi:hypothetical protein